MASPSNSSFTTAQSHQYVEKYLEGEEGAFEMHEKPGVSVDHYHDPETVVQHPFRRQKRDEKYEKRILRKLDFHLLPFVSVLYLLSFL
jgi:hypothetical protein